MPRGKAEEMGFERVFYVHRKPGKFSPKSKMLFPKVGPHFTQLTSQQKKIAEAGRKCGAEVRGIKDVYERRRKMGECIRKYFGYA